MDIDVLLRNIKSGPQGRQVAAFFDFDGTIIAGYSAEVLYAHRLRGREIGALEALRTMRVAFGEVMSEAEFETFMLMAVKAWEGRPESFLDELGDILYKKGIAGALFHEAWRLVKAHVRAGHTVVIASSATRVQIAPVAKDLGVEHILCTELEVVDGTISGRVAGRTLWGEGKLAAVEAFAAEHGVKLEDAYAYANGGEDVPLLAAVGHPYAVNPQPQLEEEARRHDWPVLSFARRSKRLNPLPLIRTTAMWGSMIAAGGAGFAVDVLSRDRWRGVNFMTKGFATLAGAIGDVHVDIRGREHLEAARPAVILINHQNDLIDLIVGATVIPEKTTGVMKKEAKNVPLIGQVLTWAQVAWIDRVDNSAARGTMSEAVERIHEGVSIVVAPEGTRSYTPSVGQFKKGAFHLAAEAGVPIVPVVIRNSGQLMPRSSKVARPGTVEVYVHPPIPTTGWTKSDVDAAVEDVRRLYQETLEDWPA